MKNPNWTREELILALNLYLKMPFGKMHSRNPDVIQLSKIIGRTPGSVTMRLGNFASVDPYQKARGIKGLEGGRKQCEPIWNEFIANKEELLFESERILAEREHQNLEDKFKDVLTDISTKTGEEKIREVKTRVNQSIFRQIILANYSSKCAISGVSVRDLLVASHIIPWSKEKKERLNPENGLCLSAIHDKAFDKGLIGIDTDFKVLISKELKDYSKQGFFKQYFGQFENEVVSLPYRHIPNKDFLRYHLDNIFRQ